MRLKDTPETAAVMDSGAPEQNYQHVRDVPRHPQTTLDLADDQIMVLLRHTGGNSGDQGSS